MSFGRGRTCGAAGSGRRPRDVSNLVAGWKLAAVQRPARWDGLAEVVDLRSHTVSQVPSSRELYYPSGRLMEGTYSPFP
jgi:hypothetical protein